VDHLVVGLWRSVALAGVIVLTGCAQSRQASQTSAPCETVTGTATSYGRALTLRYADNNFRSQVPDARGERFGAGLRRTRVGSKRVVCQPYRLFGSVTGLTTCTVQARLCGR
jgi:hypothetical protein